jgi:hypothetical protein
VACRAALSGPEAGVSRPPAPRRAGTLTRANLPVTQYRRSRGRALRTGCGPYVLGGEERANTIAIDGPGQPWRELCGAASGGRSADAWGRSWTLSILLRLRRWASPGGYTDRGPYGATPPCHEHVPRPVDREIVPSAQTLPPPPVLVDGRKFGAVYGTVGAGRADWSIRDNFTSSGSGDMQTLFERRRRAESSPGPQLIGVGGPNDA